MAAVVEFATPPARNARFHARVHAPEYLELANGNVEPAISGIRGERMDRPPGECTGSGRDRSAGVFGAPPVLVLLTSVVLLAGFLLMSGVLRTEAHMVSEAAPGAAHAPTRSGDYVVVGPGDTLRSVAIEYAPAADQAQVVDAIRVLNGGELEVELGQVLALPVLEE